MASSITRTRPMRADWMACGACTSGSTVPPGDATKPAPGGGGTTNTKPRGAEVDSVTVGDDLGSGGALFPYAEGTIAIREGIQPHADDHHQGRRRYFLQGLGFGSADRVQPRLAALGRRLGHADAVFPGQGIPGNRA